MGGLRGGAEGGGGAGGNEHTRQPPPKGTTEPSEVHVIDPVPNTKFEGPAVPPKKVCAPAVLGMLSLSQHASVEKKVAVMRLPMASEVGVMVHVWLLL